MDLRIPYSRMIFSPSPGSGLLAALGIGMLVLLGIWQLRRADEKVLIQHEYQIRQAKPPLEFTGLDARRLTITPGLPELRYRRLRVNGVYQRHRQFLLDNRTHKGVPGYHVLTALRIAAGPWGVLVDRGWLALGPSREQLPVLSTPAGSVTLQGLLEIPRSDTLVLGATGYQGQGWPKVVERIELEKMSDLLGYRLLPFILLQDSKAPGPLIREWHPYHGISPDRHRAYAFQWFALAVTLFALYVWACSSCATD